MVGCGMATKEKAAKINAAADARAAAEKKATETATIPQQPKPTVEAPKVVVTPRQLSERGRFRDGLQYFEEQPFTGVVVNKYDNGQKWWEATYKDGKNHLYTTWHRKGQKWWERTYKDNKLHGLETEWHDNGQKKGERTFKDGKKHGLVTYWDRDGQKWREFTYKDGKTISGKVWIFHENGQNKKEYTYKGDKLISTKEWNEDGDPK